MKKRYFLAILALAFIFIACKNPAGSSDPDNPGGTSGAEPHSTTYTGIKNGVKFTLVITPRPARAAADDGYVLTYKRTDSEKDSSGIIVKIIGNIFTLLPSFEGAKTFTVTIGNTSITNITGTITFDDGSTEQGPGAFSSGGGGGSGGRGGSGDSDASGSDGSGGENGGGSSGSGSGNPPAKPVTVSFYDLGADGSASDTTTKLTLTFDKDISGLSASDITLNAGSTGASKGSLAKTGTGVYELGVSGISAAGQVSVRVSKSGFIISPASLDVDVIYNDSPTRAFSITFAQIIDAAPSIPSGITIYRSSRKTPTSAVLSVEYPENYNSIIWHINGTSVKGISLRVHSMHYEYYSVGQHFLTLEVVRNGIPYTKRVTFILAE